MLDYMYIATMTYNDGSRETKVARLSEISEWIDQITACGGFDSVYVHLYEGAPEIEM